MGLKDKLPKEIRRISRDRGEKEKGTGGWTGERDTPAETRTAHDTNRKREKDRLRNTHTYTQRGRTTETEKQRKATHSYKQDTDKRRSRALSMAQCHADDTRVIPWVAPPANCHELQERRLTHSKQWLLTQTGTNVSCASPLFWFLVCLDSHKTRNFWTRRRQLRTMCTA